MNDETATCPQHRCAGVAMAFHIIASVQEADPC